MDAEVLISDCHLRIVRQLNSNWWLNGVSLSGAGWCICHAKLCVWPPLIFTTVKLPFKLHAFLYTFWAVDAFIFKLLACRGRAKFFGYAHVWNATSFGSFVQTSEYWDQQPWVPKKGEKNRVQTPNAGRAYLHVYAIARSNGYGIGWPLVLESRAKSWNLGRPVSRPGKSWKIRAMSCIFLIMEF